MDPTTAAVQKKGIRVRQALVTVITALYPSATDAIDD
jgi:hypothetical protein